MTSLDLRSFNLLAGLQCVVMGLVLLGMRRNLPAKVQGLSAWAYAPFLALASTFFYALQGHAPATLVGLGGNGLLMASTLALLGGTSKFLGRPWRWAPWNALLALSLLGLFLFFVVWPDYRPRMLIFGLTMGTLCAVHAHLLANHGRGFASKLMMTAMIWQTLVLVARAVSTYWIDQPTTERFDSGSIVHTVFVATFSFSIMVMLAGALLMANEKVRQEFEHLARHDHLTAALNRRAILSQVEQEHVRWQRYGQPYALILFDLDYFKRINDTYGHQAGDITLTRVAQTVMKGLRNIDQLGRYGGEEFIVLLPGMDAESARGVAERIRCSVAEIPAEKQVPSCTVSIGLTVVSPDDDSSNPVIGRADKALYEAKASGRNQVRVG